MDPSVLTVHDPEVDAAVREGRPLPERDIEPEAFTVALPLPFAAAGTQRLSGYVDLKRVCQAAGLQTPIEFDSPASSRYTLFRAERVATSKTTSAFPQLVSVKKEVSQSLDYAVIAAVDRRAPAWDQLKAALEPARALETISTPADIGREAVHVLSLEGRLSFSAATSAAFDFNWLRELAAGKVRGDIGLTLSGRAGAAVEITLSGSFSCTVELDERGWLRLRVFKRNRSDFRLPGSIALAAQMEVPSKEAVRELAAALLGVHHLQWLKDLVETARTGVPEWLADKLSIPAARLSEFVAAWEAIDARAASAIWDAAASRVELERIGAWAGRIAAELQDLAVFDAALGNAIESDQGFTRSAASLWMEAVAGSLAAAAADPDAFARLRKGADAAASLLTKEGMAETLASLRRYATAEIGIDRVSQALAGLDSYAMLDTWVRKQIEELCGSVASLLDLMRVSGYLETLTALAERAYEKAAGALRQKAAAQLAYGFESSNEQTALIDCSLSFTPAGLALYRQALNGDFTGLLAANNAGCVVLRRGALTHSLAGRTHLELSLPFIGRRGVDSMWKTLASVEIVPADDGRMLAYSVEASDEFRRRDFYRSALAFSGGLQLGGRVHSAESFTLGWTSLRRMKRDRARQSLRPLLNAYGFDDAAARWLTALPAEADVEAFLSLSAPGSYASAWLDAPAAGTGAYLRVFSAMSVAVQAAMRRWLPCVYFDDPKRYEDLGAAMPLIVYQSTIPYTGVRSGQFTYDFMTSEPAGLDRVSTLIRLRGELGRVRALLIASGRSHSAKFYAPDEARPILARVRRSPRQYRSLLAGDAFLVDSLVGLAARGRAFRTRAATDPVRAVCELARFASGFVSAFHGKLRRLYGGDDFASFGPLLLVEATAALYSALVEPARIAAVLRLSSSSSAGAAEQSFVNAAFRP